jgi:EAL domain-containing protein (putative c-di-GMP-specific phosphodiesterase class I)
VMAEPFLVDGHESYASLSIGIAIYPGDGESVEALLKNADTAMYHAKAQGKNTYQFYAQDMNAKAQLRLRLEQGLRHALEQGELTLHYQPQIDLAGGGLIGVEALLRWTSRHLGPVPPGEFIPVAEDTGLIIPLGNWVIETACRQAQAWRHQGHPSLRLAVNLSPLQFRHPQLAGKVRQALEDSGLPAEALELEITESVLMQNTNSTLALLRELREIGVHLSVDDFGTGYSSLSYLKRFPISRLKIDQSFVRDLTIDADNDAIVTAIIALADKLNLGTVAEGVETGAQLEFLCRHHCQVGQGYYFAQALPVEDLIRFLAQGRSAEGPSS